MNLNQELLSVFKTAIETGSFSATARKLGKAPSAVSMAISQLEDELNLVLFDRSRREPIPTAAAQALYQSTLQTLASMQQWQNHALQLSDQVESVLSIAFATELEGINWINVYQQLSETFPSLKLELLTLPQQMAIEDLSRHRIDFAVLLEREQLNNHEQFLELGKENMLAVSAPQHALAQKIASYDDLLNTRQIIFNSRDMQKRTSLQLAYHTWQTDNQYHALELIKAGLAWGFLPQSFIQRYLDVDELRILNIADFNANMPICVDLVWSREQPMGKVGQYFIELVRMTKR